MVIIETISIGVGITGILVSLWAGKDKVRESIKDFWPSENIMVIGPKAAGKTSLLHYLQGKTIPRLHNETGYKKPVGKILKKFNSTEKKLRSRRTYDVGGELEENWNINREGVFAEINPHGVIFIVDNNNINNEKKALEQFMSIHAGFLAKNKSEDVNFNSLLFLINKADIWRGNTNEAKIVLAYEKKFADLFRELRKNDIDIYISWCSLYEEETHGEGHLDKALLKFANAVTRKKE